MQTSDHTLALEPQIDQWRSYLRRRQAIHSVDVAELEDHLREQVAVLMDAGLATDEAFLVAVKRMGDLDALSKEFAREHSDRLWKQLVVSPASSGEPQAAARLDAMIAFGLAVAAALAIKLPSLFGIPLAGEEGFVDSGGFYFRNLSLFVLPLLTGYFAWKRQLDTRTVCWLILGFVVAAVFANSYPLVPGGNTEVLTALHLPIALWLLVGIAYTGGRWSEVAGRMDFIRFSGELFIYYVLIALGGGVLTAFMALIFQAIGIDVEFFLTLWLLPCGAMGAVLIGAWLVDAKQSVIENMAPVLTRLFTPLFAAVLVTFLAALLWTGRGIDIGRNVLIAFDLLLVIVLGLLLYAISARDPRSPPGAFDIVQVILVISALLADAVA
ncbi:MAG TPA: permease prefix domain 1-containing protein, partial [Gammaproteobacteria bacterium]|nr:permease prefix domain 1-containing protein [Gammaproteobacteria bacterium]